MAWSDADALHHLTHDRVGMWDREQVALLARTQLRLAPGQTVVDVGCGSGHLGLMLGPFIPGGRYIGVDRDGELLRHAWYALGQQKRARDAAARIDLPLGFEGLIGDAARLPLGAALADVAACHTLLIHLGDPSVAIAEMARVLKPGGVIAIFEPDNTVQLTTDNLAKADITLRIEMQELFWRMHEGRRLAGRGDAMIGPKVALMLQEAGFRSVRVRVNHETDLTLRERDPGNKRDPKKFARHLAGWLSAPDEVRAKAMEPARADFIAGGGTGERFDAIQARSLEYQRAQRAALDELGRDAFIQGFTPIYCTTAIKPE